MTYEKLANLLLPLGLMCRGGFHPDIADGVPNRARTVVMIGNAGPGMWQAFAKYDSTDATDPLDRWTRRVLDPVAEQMGARAVYPFDGPPYFPFQTWAMRADDVTPSPIGPLMHPVFGLWHAYRAAFLFADNINVPDVTRTPPPCDGCVDRPCLKTCPVGAFGDEKYDVPACRAHVGGQNGRDCLERGCLARRACPVGRDYIYDAPQAAFHMRHFLAGLG